LAALRDERDRDVVAATRFPATLATLQRELGQLGIAPRITLLVHSSLARLGFVAGGAQSVVVALLEAVGPAGTLVMPTHSGGLTKPARWQRPSVPAEWWPIIEAETPPFDPALTPTRRMGAIVECFRHVTDVRRSHHPSVSFAACGPNAASITDGHELAYGLGEGSPLARLYELDAWVLLLGVGHPNNTSLHLAEYRSNYPGKQWITQASPVLVDGQRRWVEYPDLDGDASDFEALGEDFARSGQERRGQVGTGAARLMRQRVLVDYAASWFEATRTERHP
jgi:aminoglycoside 3-N-acetyltransferase